MRISNTHFKNLQLAINSFNKSYVMLKGFEQQTVQKVQEIYLTALEVLNNQIDFNFFIGICFSKERNCFR